MNKQKEQEILKHLSATKKNLESIRGAVDSISGVSKCLRNAELEILTAIDKIKMERQGVDKANEEIFGKDEKKKLGYDNNGKKKTI